MDITPFLPFIQSLGPWGILAATVLGALHIWRKKNEGTPVVLPVVVPGPQSPLLPLLPLIPASGDRPILDAILKLLRDVANRRAVQELATADVPLSVASVPAVEHASDPSAVHPENFTSWSLVDLVETRYAMDGEIAKRKAILFSEWAALVK